MEPCFSGMTEAQRKLARRLVIDINPAAKLESYHSAFVGVLYRCGALPPVAIYDVDRCLEFMAREWEVDPENVMDTFCYSALRALPNEGEHGAAFIHCGCFDPDCYEESEFAEGFEAAFLGLVEHAGARGAVAGYSLQEAIEILKEDRGLDAEAAEGILWAQLAANPNELGPAFVDLVPEMLEIDSSLVDERP